jgi:endogenous inhibitor of DNA gyrase (YacG/DUF329 family)
MRVLRVMIRCPNTGRAVDTGVETTSQEEFASEVLVGQSVACPHCGQTHTWSKPDAFLLVDDDPSTPASLWRPNAYRR